MNGERRESMKRSFITVMFAVAAAGSISVMFAGSVDAAQPTGETLFKQHCAVCHVDGGNLIAPQKTLHKKDREANNIKTAEAIIKTMRNPGPGMTQFNEKTMPEKDAKAIAEYILTTFK
jgi:cytochrome c6